MSQSFEKGVIMLSQELIIRGKKADQIVKYFEDLAFKEYNKTINFETLSQSDPVRPNKFDYKIEVKDWLVELTHEKEIYISKMVFPEVIVRISADKSRLENLVYQFRIQFLSAGG